jgi:hypothetical protein
MKNTAFRSKLTMVVLTSVALFGTASVSAAQDFRQTPIILKAKDILPQDLLQGENYKVENEVKNDGIFNTYQLNTDYGQITVESDSILMIRIAELKALKAMEELQRSEAFAEAVGGTVSGTVKGAGKLVTSPVETSKNIAKGTGRYLSNLGRSFFSDDPDQDNAMSVAIGYDVTKRGYAYEFGIDPYTHYEPVTSRLGEISRSSAAGGLAPKVALAVVGGAVATGVSIGITAEGMRQLVRDNSPGELTNINKKKLETMGIETKLVEAFLNNYTYNPQEETFLVGALESMKNVKGRDAFIALASLAKAEDTAVFYRLSAQMMEAYHINVAPVIRIRNINGNLRLQKKDGTFIILQPLDYIYWTKDVQRAMKTADSDLKKLPEVSGKEMWIPGKFDKKAREMLMATDWKIQENANDVLLKKKK